MLYLRAAVALVMPLVVDVVVPAWLLHTSEGRFDVGSWRWVGLPLIVLGIWLLLDSVFLRFAGEGRGTLAPVDPPRFVVRGGAYRVVRNPMYVANVAILAGTGLLFGSWAVLLWGVVMAAVFHLFVVGFEEPDLHRRFGDDYDRYRRRVGRWLPRAASPPDAAGDG